MIASSFHCCHFGIRSNVTYIDAFIMFIAAAFFIMLINFTGVQFSGMFQLTCSYLFMTVFHITKIVY